LLDLLGQPLLPQRGFKRGILYFDDDQIQALSVTCSHGAAAPSIRITATGFGDFLEDLDLAMYAVDHTHQRNDDERSRWGRVEDRSELLPGEERDMRKVVGDEFYEHLLNLARGEAQHNLLKAGGVSVRDLGFLYNRIGAPAHLRRRIRLDYCPVWEDFFRDGRWRIVLGELPQETGSSKAYRADALKKIREFQRRNPGLLRSLNIPVAVVVVIKPPRQARGMHDLDNVLRDYVIPRIVDTFQPPSNVHWALNPRLDRRHDRSETFMAPSIHRAPPSSTRTGLARYEAWRLTRHPGDSTAGFVSISIVPYDYGLEGAFSRIERAIAGWEHTVDR
jgi:hypothetical protein